MRLATLRSGGPDGQLIIVSKDALHGVSAQSVAPTLQAAVENWTDMEPRLRTLSYALDQGSADDVFALDPAACGAPLPRAWQWLDASTYPSHAELMDKALGITPEKFDRPMMYQGMSDHFYGPLDDIPMPDEALGIDFEGEFGIITDKVPMGVTVEQAQSHIKLLVQINDWSLRALAGTEMKSGFGWIQAKPACSMAPFAVTPDELGDAWSTWRPGLRLRVHWNGRVFSEAHGAPMAYGFDQLIAHAARTRQLAAGTVIGSGTVSNADFREVGSSCIAERRGIEVVDEGRARTPFMQFGDTVRMEASLPSGFSPFGTIEQKVVRA